MYLLVISLLVQQALQVSCTSFASTPVQINTATSDYFFYFDKAIPLNTDVDIVAVHDDYYGVPWSAFLGQGSLPISWMTRLNSTLEAVLNWNKPVYLAYEMLSGPLRTCPAQNASDGPGNSPVVTAYSSCTSCFDFSLSNPEAVALQKAYALYASFMIEAYLNQNITLVGINLAAEINLGANRLCDFNWFTGVIEFYNGVYQVVKNLLSSRSVQNVPVFPSIQIESLMEVQSGQACANELNGDSPSPSLLSCIANGLALVQPLLKDSFGISTYPPMVNGDPVPKWYLDAVLQQLSPKDRSSFLIAETGWNRVSTIVNLANGSIGLDIEQNHHNHNQQQHLLDPPVDCALVVNSSITLANEWLLYLINLSSVEKWAFITWWSDTDLLYESSLNTCPCSTPPEFSSSCTFITALREIEQLEGGVPAQGELVAKAFGSMGLRSLDGSTTLLWDTLQKARQGQV
jgi:hypothetical protein